MYYVAFYTDCERELSQVTRGSLLTLVYNLRRVPTAATASSSSSASSVGGVGQKGIAPTGPGRPSSSKAAAAAAAAAPAEEIRAWAMEDAGFFSASASGGGGSGPGVALAPGPPGAGGTKVLAGIGDSPWANVSCV